MKKSIALFVAIFSFFNFSVAQKKLPSPPETATGKINEAAITINYGSPSVKGRVIWGKLVPFDKVWRAGANEATTFETSKDITVEGSKLPAGKYSFFLIPNEKECTLIFSKQQKQWGAYDYKEKEDQLRIKVSPKVKTEATEKLLYTVSSDKVVLSWEKWDVEFKVN